MKEKKFINEVEETYTVARTGKNELTFILFGMLILVLAGLGVFWLVAIRFGHLPTVVVEIITTVSVILNVFTGFMLADRGEQD